MKTTSLHLSKIFGSLILLVSLLSLNPVQATNSSKSFTNTSPGSEVKNLAYAGNDETLAADTQITTIMLEDPNYWVNFLKSTVNPDADDTNNISSAIEEMQSKPYYWIDYLKNVEAED